MEQMNATAACVLGLMQLGPAPGQEGFGRGARGMTGWQVHEAARVSVSRFWNLTRSQIYRELASLEDAGYVAPVGEPGARSSQTYRVTASGEAAFRRWIEAFAGGDPREEQLRSPLVLAVFFGEFLTAPTLHRLLVEHRARHQRRRDQLQAMTNAVDARTAPRLPAAVLARGLRYQALVVEWLDDLLATVGPAPAGDPRQAARRRRPRQPTAARRRDK
jgi:DNA-binding PadR family transcriptional regulator